MPDQVPILTSIARQQIVKVLAGRGFRPTVRDGAVELGVGGIAFRCSVPGIQNHPGAAVVAIAGEVLVPAAGAGPLQDSAVGTDDTVEKAVAAGVEAWINGILPPVLAASGLGKPEEAHPFDLCQIDAAKGVINNWDVFAGPFQVAGPDRDHLAGHLEAQQPFTLLLRAGIVPPIPIQPGLFWMKLFLCRQESGQLSSECRLNNHEWPGGAAALSQFEWPTEPGFLLFRQFIVGKLLHSSPYRTGRPWWKLWK